MDQRRQRVVYYYTIDKNANGGWVLSWEDSPAWAYLSGPRYLLQNVARLQGWHPLRECDMPTTEELDKLR
jgi:hypothetical protein